MDKSDRSKEGTLIDRQGLQDEEPGIGLGKGKAEQRGRRGGQPGHTGLAGNATANLRRLHEELRNDTYRPQPVLQHKIPKPGQRGKFRKLGIPTVYDRVCQQALLNRM